MLYCLYCTYGYLYSSFNYNEINFKIQLLGCTGHIPKSEKATRANGYYFGQMYTRILAEILLGWSREFLSTCMHDRPGADILMSLDI